MPHRDGGGPGVAHHQRHRQRRHLVRPALVERPDILLERDQPADAGAKHTPDATRLVVALAVPAGLLDCLLCGDKCELREAIRAPGLLAGEEVERVEALAGSLPVLDRYRAGGPALEQRVGAHAKRRDRADSGDDDLSHDYLFATMKSTASPTVLRFSTSDDLNLTPYSSSTICDSSARSSESTSSSSNVASRLICAGSAPKVSSDL